MTNFIKVNFKGDGHEIRINVNNIVAFYWQENKEHTYIACTNGEAYFVSQTPKEIDCMIEGTIYNEEEDINK